ncbi:SEC-C domain-containing protein [Nocardiopsis sp. N85]|uniref:SEC-C domain-containing protein n=1 Tax=Nocardiopsis sp. N85 TaxID=3029400 RepID=UPI00237F2FFD|nr:SEC-C domain-containing protein [Nocardiopsis sp. N85]MDE3720533.1 SEC-C domain-containing protein [Nocardiopsis sp. N85]
MTHETLPEPLQDVISPRLWEVIRGLDLPREFLTDLVDFPHEVGDVLLDTVEYLERADRPDAARRLLEAVRADAPTRESGQYAAYSLADRLREDGATRDADAIIDVLVGDPALMPGPAHLLAELLEELGDVERALRCFNIACRDALSRPADDLEPDDALEVMTLQGRARTRERLGLPEDDHDRAARLAFDGLSDTLGAFDDEYPDDPVLLQGVRPVFSRDSLPRARQAGLTDATTPENDHYTDAERELRAGKRERPETRFFTVTADADEVAAFSRAHPLSPGEDPLTTWAEETIPEDSPRLSPWPPGRNEPCWCGSTRKYKKCCGTPALS